MYKKIILPSLLVSASSLSFALGDNAEFRKFDTQVSLGYQANQMTLQNGASNQALEQTQNMTIDIERLFAMGLWVDISSYLTFSDNSLGNQAVGTGQGIQQPASQNPYVGGVNAKVGYAFMPVTDHLQVTPYGMIGRNSNISMSTVLANNYSNLTNDYFFTAGLGGRIEYRINQYLMVYFDQAISYNWDQSAPQFGNQPQNNMNYTSLLGLKYNAYQYLQIGANLLYTNYQYMSNASTTTSINGGTQNGQLVSTYQPQNSFGGGITIGLTY